MGCNSDYMNPTQAERNSKVVCEHLVYLSEKTKQTVPQWVHDAAAHIYGKTSKLQEATVMLCSMCKEADESIIYNGRCPKARNLANWWDIHQAADRKREQEEKEEAKQQELKEKALSKLTESERNALGF